MYGISKDKYAGAMELPLSIFNTATKSMEKVTLLKAGLARGYVCGLTPQSSMHVGHARTIVFFDVFRRYLEYLGLDTRLVTNFTDVDDKIIEKAKQEFGGEAIERWYDVPKRYIEEYFKVVDALYVRRAYAYPKVTDNIGDMIKWIEMLIRKNAAYVSNGSVYFDISRVPDYGDFSGQKIQDLEAGARVEPEPGKKGSLDFALWKAWKEGEPWWSSPWSPGRPGWHLECVTMSTKYLGAPFDFHGGGQDLIFPHHENEVAIARIAFGVKYFAKYWMHVGYVTMGGEKMSKSVGNVITAKEALSRHDGEALRLYYMMTHYRKPMEFTVEGLDSVQATLRGLYASYDYVVQLINEARDEGGTDDELVKTAVDYMIKIEQALNDDMNTPQAVSNLVSLSNYVNSQVLYKGDKLTKYALSTVLNVLGYAGQIFGIFNRTMLPPKLVDAVNAMIKVRQRLREAKLFDAADEIRRELEDMGVVINDAGKRTYWFIDREKLSPAS
ncbi:cysteine--tRNA ligase [Thermocladium modestius]|uniref:Cysteine--tRNA ligase n=2 Tax=Thermocladium modestius TaxID=62609 RepID=A0A830GW22_9CREN|nr:cysteine--tRNA ligase [Thermocladium modestius]